MRALDRLANRLVDGVLTIAASEHRAQLANREAARERMVAPLREAARAATAAAPADPPFPGRQERRLAEKKRQSQRKRDRRVDGD